MEFTLKTTIKATAKEIYSTWLDSEGHTKMTGGEAVASNKEGADFTSWDGYIFGKNIALEPFKRIVQSWRSSQFKENEKDSTIEVLLSETDGETALTLIHTDVPEDGEHYKKGWDEHYFQPMNAYFKSKSNSI
jgi:activator of HSP90 ATPase